MRFLIPMAAAAALITFAPATEAKPVWRSSVASWYGPCPDACGRAACTHKYIRPGTWGVAHKTLKCGTKLTICHGRRCVHVRVIDRGPFVSGRDLDITVKPARQIGLTPSVGIMTVKWHVGWPSSKK